MTPCRVPPTGGTQIGANRTEQQGTESGRGDGESESGQLAAGRKQRVAGTELSTSQADLGALPQGRSQGTTAWELRAALEPAYAEEFRRVVLEQVKIRYSDFGPTLASEHLSGEEGLKVHAETLRRWMKEAGL